MYHSIRKWHRWFGIAVAVLLVTIATTGFFLALKRQIPWMRPPERSGTEVANAAEIISVERAADAAFATGNPYLKTMDDVDRVDYRPGDNIFKVVSKKGYQEIQVDGKTGKVLSIGFRTDQLFENIHDFSFFHKEARTYVAPVAATGLMALAITGIIVFVNPILRRRKYRREHPA